VAGFVEFMRDRLPATIALPDVLADLFEWIDGNGWVSPSPSNGEPVGGLSPSNSWMHDGTSVAFHIKPPDVRKEYSRLWTRVEGLHDRLVPFAQTGADGSEAAFWLDDGGVQHIVHCAQGSADQLVCVLATDPMDFIRLLAIGYDELCWLALPEYASAPVRRDGFSTVNQPLIDWLSDRGVTVPATAQEIVPHPARMLDLDSPDPFCDWLTRVCDW
jgi:hypothetical protein